MLVGDLVREKTRMNRPAAFGIVVCLGDQQHLVHFFDEEENPSQRVWMPPRFLEGPYVPQDL